MSAAEQQSAAAPKRKTLFNGLLNLIFGFVGFMLASTLFSVLLEWLGLFLWWRDQGALHARQLYETEVVALSEHLRNTWQGQAMAHWPTQLLKVSYYSIETKLNVLSSGYIGQFFSARFWQTLSVLLESAKYAVLTVLVRALILLLSTPVFLAAVFLGAVDGLVEWELRTWGGGRESSNQFKLARAAIGPLYLAAWLIYFSFPESIHHLWIVLPVALLLAGMTRHACFMLKKHF